MNNWLVVLGLTLVCAQCYQELWGQLLKTAVSTLPFISPAVHRSCQFKQPWGFGQLCIGLPPPALGQLKLEQGYVHLTVVKVCCRQLWLLGFSTKLWETLSDNKSDSGEGLSKAAFLLQYILWHTSPCGEVEIVPSHHVHTIIYPFFGKVTSLLATQWLSIPGSQSAPHNFEDVFPYKGCYQPVVFKYILYFSIEIGGQYFLKISHSFYSMLRDQSHHICSVLGSPYPAYLLYLILVSILPWSAHSCFCFQSKVCHICPILC